MARSNLYVVHLVEKNVDWIDVFYYFYNRRSAVAFIRMHEDECFVSLEVYVPDCSGMFHVKNLSYAHKNSNCQSARSFGF